MIINNRLDQSFGPVGTSAGVAIFLAGMILIFFSFSGLIAIFIGAFVGFTYTSTLVDYDHKRIKFSNNLFGFIRIGQWFNVEPNMSIGVKKSNRTWRAFSRGNETLDIAEKDYRITIFDSNGKQIIPIKKMSTLELAKLEQEIMAKELGLGLI